jgi:4-carboxymuconolactone decarboxylase
MARVPYPEPSASPEVAELYTEIAGVRGSVHNLQRSLGNNPAALRAFMGMSRYVRGGSSFPPRLRELVVLAVAHAQNVQYEIFYHVPAARRAGVSDEQLAAFPNWAASDQFSPRERAAMSYADQAARQLDVDDATFETLRAHLSLPEIVDLALTVGWYCLCSAILVPLRIEPGTNCP